MEYIVGYIDDDASVQSSYKKRFERHEIELKFAPHNCTLTQLSDWIAKSQIKTLLIDYKLQREYNFSGSAVISFLNKQMPDLPCIIITNFIDDCIGDAHVIKNLILDRSLLDEVDLSAFSENVKHSVQVFEQRLADNLSAFMRLQNKRDSEPLSSDDEEQYLQLYGILRAYGQVDELPKELLTSRTDKKLDYLISILEKLDLSQGGDTADEYS